MVRWKAFLEKCVAKEAGGYVAMEGYCIDNDNESCAASRERGRQER